MTLRVWVGMKQAPFAAEAGGDNARLMLGNERRGDRAGHDGTQTQGRAEKKKQGSKEKECEN